jgi:hypothetical protein
MTQTLNERSVMKTSLTILGQGHDRWHEMISEQEASGLSVSAYCRKQGINEKTFYNWRKKLVGVQNAKPKKFIRIKSVANACGNVLRIETPGGYRLEVPPGIEKEQVQNILEALAVVG